MFLMTRRAGAILDHAGLVEIMLLVATLAFSIDGIEGDTVLKALFQDGPKFLSCERAVRGLRFVMTLRAVVGEAGVIARDLPDVEKRFAAEFVKQPNSGEPSED